MLNAISFFHVFLLGHTETPVCDGGRFLLAFGEKELGK
jgi:hypothetical protein